jgi:hypothetical protein
MHGGPPAASLMPKHLHPCVLLPAAVALSRCSSQLAKAATQHWLRAVAANLCAATVTAATAEAPFLNIRQRSSAVLPALIRSVLALLLQTCHRLCTLLLLLPWLLSPARNCTAYVSTAPRHAAQSLVCIHQVSCSCICCWNLPLRPYPDVEWHLLLPSGNLATEALNHC